MKRYSIPQILALVVALSMSSCASLETHRGKNAEANNEWQIRAIQQGKASWYGIRCNGGTQTASGERLCNHAPTAAHKTLPMGTKVRVINLSNGKSEIVTINDRGPFKPGRIIDVTEGVAKRLDFYKRGIVPVKVEVLEKNETGTAS
jgi:rare lipoprotein A